MHCQGGRAGEESLSELVKWLLLLGNCSRPMHSRPINSPASLSVACRLAALQSRLPPIAARMRLKLSSCRLTGCTAAAILSLSSPLSLSLCSHGLSLRQSRALQAPLIITTIYGNPLSSQYALTSRGLTSYTGDDTLSLCIHTIMLRQRVCVCVGVWGCVREGRWWI